MRFSFEGDFLKPRGETKRDILFVPKLVPSSAGWTFHLETDGQNQLSRSLKSLPSEPQQPMLAGGELLS